MKSFLVGIGYLSAGLFLALLVLSCARLGINSNNLVVNNYPGIVSASPAPSPVKKVKKVKKSTPKASKSALKCITYRNTVNCSVQ